MRPRQDSVPGEGDVEPAGETRELLRRWHDQADHSAREELVTRMLPLARSLARRYANKGEPLDDLEQVASVGLLKAIDRFDLDREVKFATFAVPTIAGEIKRHFRDRGWMLRVPREVQELNARLSRTREALTRDLGRAPTVEELAARAGARSCGCASSRGSPSARSPTRSGSRRCTSRGSSAARSRRCATASRRRWRRPRRP